MVRTLELLLLLFAIAPFVVLSGAAHPATDDFCFANQMRDLGFLGSARWWYAEWTGRFAAIAMINLGPLSFGSLAAYKAIPVVILAALFLALLWLAAEVVPGVAAPRRARLALLGLVLYVNTVISPAESLYWYAGATIFTVGSIFAILAVAAALRAGRRPGIVSWGWAAVGALAALFAGGSNEVTLLLLLLVLLAIAFGAWHAGHWSLTRWMMPLGATVLAGIVNVLAPGNARRVAATGGGEALAGPFAGSAVYAASSVFDWLSHAPIFLAGAGLVVAGIHAGQRTRGDEPWARTSWTVPAGLALGGVWAALFLTHWASGFVMRPGPPYRVLGTVLLYFMIVGGVAAFMAGAQALRTHRAVADAALPAGRWLTLVIAALAFGTGNVHKAWVDLASGRAAAYDEEMVQRYATLRAAQGRDGEVAIAPLARVPLTVHVRDITPDPADWRNACYARYWGVRGTRLTD